MKLPFALPYKCEQPGCGCADEYPAGSGAYVRVRSRTGEAHSATIMEDGMILDVFHDHDVTELLLAVHREYPGAESHEPYKGKVARNSHGDGAGYVDGA